MISSRLKRPPGRFSAGSFRHCRAGRRALLIALGLIVGLAACQGPAPRDAGSDDRQQWFEDVSKEVGPTFVYRSGAEGDFMFPEIMGGGVALLDIDADGDLDVYFVQGGDLRGPTPYRNVLWRNLAAEDRAGGHGGALRFEDVSSLSGADDDGYGMGVAVGDYDSDGDSDLYVTNVGSNVLLRNRGDGIFEDVTLEAGVGETGWGTSAAFLDYDNDTDLDLFVVNYVSWTPEGDLECLSRSGGADYCSPVSYDAPTPATLYRNDGRGVFTDVSAAAGLRSAFGNGLGVVVTDFDKDGWQDIFVANDQSPNHLWRNLGAQRPGTFEEVALLAGCAVDEGGGAKAGMGVTAADLDDDGDEDLLVVNLQAQSDSLFLNEGGWFVDATARAGLGLASRPLTRFGVGFEDFDNDGYLDLYQVAGRVTLPDLFESESGATDLFAEPNVLLKGLPDLSFEAVDPPGGTLEPLVSTSRAAAFGDLDVDGGVDLVVVNRDAGAYILRNVVPDRGLWVRFRILDSAGADALGAQLELIVGERRIFRTVRASSSYQASSDPTIHIGLGEAQGVDEATVHWLDGCREVTGPLEAERTHTLRHPPH